MNDSGKLLCNKCFDGFFSKNNLCVRCTSPCATCSSETECKSCIKGHLLEGTSCNSKCSPLCASCENTDDSCVECNDGYMLNGTTCLKCPDECKTCDIEGKSSVCTSCFEGFYLLNGKCNACYHECATCFDSSNTCHTCREGYYKYSQNIYYNGLCKECNEGTDHCTKCTSDFPEGKLVFTCTECEEGYFVKDNKCEPCHETCKTCDGKSDQNCITCKEEFYFVDGKCVPCSDSCLTCNTSSTECTSCKSHHYLSDGQCLECNETCLECSDSNTCTKCPEFFFMHEGKCLQSCTSIDEGWGGNDDFECVKCNLDHCLTYDDSCQCTNCSEGYYIISDEITLIEYCLPCQLDHCSKCTGSEINDCYACEEGYELQTDPATGRKMCVILCDEGYFINYKNECEKCKSPCKICSGSDGSICKECEEGYFFNNNSCSFFPADCEIEKHCENENKGDKPVQIVLETTKFDSFKNEKSGGALRIVNCGLSGDGVSFNDCISQKGGGGAIYIFNEKDIDQPITLKQMSFTSCKAAFGGAVYIYSVSKSPSIIESCTFTNNNVFPPYEDSQSMLTGGSSLYLTVKEGAVRQCSFVMKEALTTGIIKTSDNFTLKPEGLKMLNNDVNEMLNLVEIIKCSFKFNDVSNSSSSSSLYFVEKQAARLFENNKIIEFNSGKDEAANRNKKEVANANYQPKVFAIVSAFILVAVIVAIVIQKRKQNESELENYSIDSINA